MAGQFSHLFAGNVTGMQTNLDSRLLVEGIESVSQQALEVC